VNREIGNRLHLFLILMVAVAAAACVADAPEPESRSERHEILETAFSQSESDPARAAALFADAGPGSSLETSRMTVWAACLERANAGPDGWRRYLEDRPPEQLATRARLALVRTLIERGFFETALSERSRLPSPAQPQADRLLLDVDDPAIHDPAARRLAISSPAFLSSADGELDRNLVSTLSRQELLARSDAWIRAERPSRGIAELRRKTWSGEDEKRRRRALARAALAANSPRQALNELPHERNSDAEDFILRAQALRDRGWHLFPGRGEQRVFRNCAAAAQAALALGTSEEGRQSALILRLECSTQAELLDDAYESWRVLEAGQWSGSRRSWLGRRLGVAMARAGERDPQVQEIARSLPSQRRCLRYWMAVGAPGGDDAIRAELAGAEIADLYGQWSREEITASPNTGPRFGDASTPATPPGAVEQLIAVGADKEALREWRRIRLSRPPLPERALAAAEMAAGLGQSLEPIRWLRSGFPELGTIEMARSPENVIRAYLPLRWSNAVVAAAGESAVEPWLIAGVARQESGFSAHAVSPRGAIGVLQLLPSTARLHARSLGFGSKPDLQDPETNIRLGAREIGALIRRFGEIEPALAAYNAGLTRVRGWWKRWPDRHRFTEEIPIPETYDYVRRVTFLADAYRLVYEEEWSDAR
jgi:soluble lytic murein transglycosylase